MTSRSLVPLLLAATVGLLGCPDDQRTDSVDPEAARRDLDPAAVAQLDSGNAAYRRGSSEVALRHYVRFTELEPDEAAGWFGLYMAHQALGNASAADSALARARDVAPGASLLRVRPEDTAQAPGGGG